MGLMSDFITWLAKTLEDRRYSHRQLAKEAGLSHSLISKVLSGEVLPSADFCIKIAEALNEPPEELLRRAGILPAKKSGSDLEEIINIYESLSPNKQEKLLALLRLLKDE